MKSKTQQCCFIGKSLSIVLPQRHYQRPWVIFPDRFPPKKTKTKFPMGTPPFWKISVRCAPSIQPKFQFSFHLIQQPFDSSSAHLGLLSSLLRPPLPVSRSNTWQPVIEKHISKLFTLSIALHSSLQSSLPWQYSMAFPSTKKQNKRCSINHRCPSTSL